MANPGNHLPVTGNSFLDSLPAATQERVIRLLKLEKLKKGQVLGEPDEQFHNIYFPIRSLISTVTLTQEGAAVEVGVAGHEGLGPLQAAFGSLISRHSCIVQIPDSAYAMRADDFVAQFRSDTDLRDRCSRYAEYSFTAATQFAACNGVHPVEERFARWILMAHDRIGTDELNLTQEYVAQMLGVRRATVTNIALALSKSDLISYSRGKISITDRAGLMNATCECYGAVNDDLQRLMGYGALQPDVQELNR